MQRSAIAAALLVSLAVASVGCVANDGSFIILQDQIPETGCTLPTTTETFLSSGTLDVSLGLGYYLYPLLQNNMQSTYASDGQPERNNLTLNHFSVELDMGNIPLSVSDELTSFDAGTSGTIPPAGVAAISVKVIKDTLAAKLTQVIPKGSGVAATITVTIKAVAKLQGSDKDSADFYFPIDVCNGCLVDYRTSCPSSSDTTILSNFCGLPQDSKITCCSSPVKCYSTSS
jgi:hypothetical protein